MKASSGDDLVLIALPGVQQFIEETRSVSDARAASEIYMRLSAGIVDACRSAGGTVIFPAALPGPDGMPNRVVASFPPGRWADVATDIGRTAENIWRGWVERALKLGNGQAPETPGMPQVQWVCVPPGSDDYAAQWVAAQRLLAARRRVRDFPSVQWRERALCDVGPRWPAEPVPVGLKAHQEVALSAAAWVKRRWRQIHRNLDGFPSTASIASAPFRSEVLARLDDAEVLAVVRDLARAAQEVIRVTQGADVRETRVPGLIGPEREPGKFFASTGGTWVYPDNWQADSLARESKSDPSLLTEPAERGRSAAKLLIEVMDQRSVPPPASYLAVIVQDLDNMGKFLSGASGSAAGDRIEVTPAAHQDVSSKLREAGGRQRPVLEDPEVLGLPVYTGGDDLLAFAPASTALEAARRCHDVVPLSLPTASTAVCFFHYHASLSHALTSVRVLLAAAKERVRGKHGLGVGYLRRSGASEVSVQPWLNRDGGDAMTLFRLFAAGQEYPLSPGLLTDLDRDRDELARLSASAPAMYQAELARLVRRHMSGNPPVAEVTKAAVALGVLGSHEAGHRPAGMPAGAWPQPAARVAVFLRQEAR